MSAHPLACNGSESEAPEPSVPAVQGGSVTHHPACSGTDGAFIKSQSSAQELTCLSNPELASELIQTPSESSTELISVSDGEVSSKSTSSQDEPMLICDMDIESEIDEEDTVVKDSEVSEKEMRTAEGSGAIRENMECPDGRCRNAMAREEAEAVVTREAVLVAGPSRHGGGSAEVGSRFEGRAQPHPLSGGGQLSEGDTEIRDGSDMHSAATNEPQQSTAMGALRPLAT